MLSPLRASDAPNPTMLGSPSRTLFNKPVGGKYLLKETIGQGAYGKVKLALTTKTSTYVAIKILPRSPRTQQIVRKELNILGALKHRNIVRFIESLDDEHNTYIVMEHSTGGELFDKVEPDHGVAPELAHFYFRQLISAVKYLHSKGVCHRDLKPENILLDEYGSLQIADFGCASVFRFKNQEKALTDLVGSAPYIAPELRRPPYIAQPVDLWSCGIILYVLLAGNTPWDEATEHSQEFRMYLDGSLLLYQPWTDHPQILPLLRGLLTVDPSERYTIVDVEADPWFSAHDALLAAVERRETQAATQLIEKVALGLARPYQRLVEGCSQHTVGNPFLIDAAAHQRITSFSQPTPHAVAGSFMASSSFVASGSFVASQRTSAPSNMGELAVKLKRFYVSSPKFAVVKRISDVLESAQYAHETHMSTSKINISTSDKRKCPVVGMISVDAFKAQGTHICLVVFRRKRGDPIEFMRIFFHVARALSDIFVPEPTLVELAEPVREAFTMG